MNNKIKKGIAIAAVIIVVAAAVITVAAYLQNTADRSYGNP